jgi:transposase-like protein
VHRVWVGGGDGAARAHGPGLLPLPPPCLRQAVQRTLRRPAEPDRVPLRRRRARGALASALQARPARPARDAPRPRTRVQPRDGTRGEAKLAPALAEELRRCQRSKAGRSWYVNETYIKVQGRWCYLYCAFDRSGALVDVMLIEHRGMAAARAFFRSVRAVTGVAPDRVTTEGHDSYPCAIRSELGKRVRHRTGRYLNDRLEQDHRDIKGRYRPMRGFKHPRSAARFCRAHDELRDFFRPRSRHHQHIPADRRRLLPLRRTVAVLGILEAV